MGMNFRKSYKFGPFRTTISKSGISTSVGVKGARITKRADGKIQTTVGIPGTGISYTSTASKRRAPAAEVSDSRTAWAEAVPESKPANDYDSAMPMSAADPTEKPGFLWISIGLICLGFLGVLILAAL